MNATKIRRTRVKNLPPTPALKWEPGPIRNLTFDLSDLSAITCVAKVAEEYEKEKAARELRLNVHEFKLRHREVCKLCNAHRLVGGQENEGNEQRSCASGCTTKNCKTIRNPPMSKKPPEQNPKIKDEIETELSGCQEGKEDTTVVVALINRNPPILVGRDVEKGVTYPLLGQTHPCVISKSDERQGKDKTIQQTKSITSQGLKIRAGDFRCVDKATSITCPGFHPANAQGSGESKATKCETPTTATWTTSENETPECASIGKYTPRPQKIQPSPRAARLPRPTNRQTQTLPSSSGLKDCCTALRKAFKVFFAVEKCRLSSGSKNK